MNTELAVSLVAGDKYSAIIDVYECLSPISQFLLQVWNKFPLICSSLSSEFQ